MFEGSGITSPLSCSLFNVTYKGYISTKVKLWDNVNLCVQGQSGCGKKGLGASVTALGIYSQPPKKESMQDNYYTHPTHHRK